MTDLPKAWGVLYAPPNPDGSKKLCANCAFWIKDEQQCIIHDEKVRILAGMVCGYHVFGEPALMKHAIEISADPIPPELSGLENVADLDGTSCSSCIFFENRGKGKGVCHGVARASGYPPQPVQALGCCARWQRS